MKLLVETLKGMRMSRSMASTFKTPDPIPSSPESGPSYEHKFEPPGMACPWQGRSPRGSGDHGDPESPTNINSEIQGQERDNYDPPAQAG
jgi:hypothetical protein